MWLTNALLIVVPATALMTVPAVAQTYGDHPHMGTWGSVMLHRGCTVARRSNKWAGSGSINGVEIPVLTGD